MVSVHAVRWERRAVAAVPEERMQLVTVCKAMPSADVQGRSRGGGEGDGRGFQRVLSAIFDALNLSEAQREMVPQVVPRVLELLIAHDPDGDGAA